jgi:6-phosphofructokinase 1
VLRNVLRGLRTVLAGAHIVGMKRIGILTSGGDAPGMNAAIRACVRTATALGVTSVGYLDGYAGFVRGRFQVLDDRSVGNVIQLGGTFIGTSRCPEFLQPEVRADAVRQMREDGVEALIVIGGDGSFKGALALQQEHGVQVAGIPGTIDNDVFGTDETVGFHTAVDTAVKAIDQLRDTGESTGMMFVVEVMGRTSGAIALHTAVAAGAAGVLVPEAHGQVDSLVTQLKASIANGKRSHIIVVAEGDEEGGAFAVADQLQKQINEACRVVVLGHVQRGGRPTARDRIVASISGMMAVEALSARRSGMMIGILGGKPVEVPLEQVVEKSHPEPDWGLLQLAQRIAG